MGTMSEVVGSRPPTYDKKAAQTPAQEPKTEKTSPKEDNEVQNMVVDMPIPKVYDNGHLQSPEGFGPQFKLISTNGQVKELQTIIRDKNTTRSDFKFYADRLIRLVVEEGLNQLPYSERTITTPTGCPYKGLQFVKGNCGVAIVRSGEAMEQSKLPYPSEEFEGIQMGQPDINRSGEAFEQGLRSCCRSIRLGKILVESDLDTHEAKVVYAKFPEDICQRKVLLMYPIMSSGNTVIKAVNVLQEHAVEEENIILLNLFATPASARSITTAFPRMQILTTEVHPVAPNHFGQKYFGTD